MSDEFAELPLVAAPIGSIATASIDEAVAKVCRDQNLAEPRLIRRSMNAVFAADAVDGPVIIRVCHPTSDSSVAIDFAHFLRSFGFEVPAPKCHRSFRHDEIEITLWEHIDHDANLSTDWSVIGAAIRRLHAVDLVEVARMYPLPKATSFPWWNFSAILDELAATFDPDDLAILSARWKILESQLTEAGRVFLDGRPNNRAVLCHGDVHPGNVLVNRRTGRPVLIDWDLLSVAPAQWDHSALLTWSTRWGGMPNVYSDFARGYGHDFTSDPLARSLAELRLLSATLMRWRAGLDSNEARLEAERRMRWWRQDPHAPYWTSL